ncbi:MAG: alpha/beta hydrolase [Bacilli bacterium]|nr:alpha/beta hydrolase [Bacilli bacterium]
MSIFMYKDRPIKYIIDGDLSSTKNIIVILNGIMMSCLSWEAFIQPFSKENTVLRFDMFDQGETAKQTEQYTQDIQVELLKSLLDYLKIKKVNLMGISYGASIALQFAVKYQEYIDKMVVANVVGKTSPWLKAIGDGWNEVAASRNGEAYYNITIPYIYSPQFYTKEIKWMENRKKILIPLFSNPAFLDAMVRLTKSAETHDVVAQLGNIRVKTLIIASEEDYLTPVFEQKMLHHNIKNSELVVIPECGHASMYEKPEIFTSLILGFINNDQVKIV